MRPCVWVLLALAAGFLGVAAASWPLPILEEELESPVTKSIDSAFYHFAQHEGKLRGQRSQLFILARACPDVSVFCLHVHLTSALIAASTAASISLVPRYQSHHAGRRAYIHTCSISSGRSVPPAVQASNLSACRWGSCLVKWHFVGSLITYATPRSPLGDVLSDLMC